MNSGNTENSTRKAQGIMRGHDGKIFLGYCPLCKSVNSYNQKDVTTECHCCGTEFSWE